ncbi:hypothetical protein [Mycolicibacterium brumae]|uniref:hypothetical protein n=1 Tax=Mycolicibacterium brumae TaxID=85968 RepID=UPI000AF55A4D|nr:hypothetical protein [Mycolicibacterium brumae]UWW07469.1 lipid droplet assembly factor 1 [Mycolicibacterium brumae]
MGTPISGDGDHQAQGHSSPPVHVPFEQPNQPAEQHHEAPPSYPAPQYGQQPMQQPQHQYPQQQYGQPQHQQPQYGYQAPAPGVAQHNNVNIVVAGGPGRPLKSPVLAAVLAFFLGPIGMLYSTIPGAATIFGVNLFCFVLGFLSAGLGWILMFFSWMAGVVWAGVAANNYNQRYTAGPVQHYAPRY